MLWINLQHYIYNKSTTNRASGVWLYIYIYKFKIRSRMHGMKTYKESRSGDVLSVKWISHSSIACHCNCETSMNAFIITLKSLQTKLKFHGPFKVVQYESERDSIHETRTLVFSMRINAVRIAKIVKLHCEDLLLYCKSVQCSLHSRSPANWCQTSNAMRY